MRRWQLQQAKQQFSRLVELARNEGPQVVMRNDEEVAVLLDIDEYRRLSSDEGAFKRFLEVAPNFDALEIERPRHPAPTIDL